MKSFIGFVFLFLSCLPALSQQIENVSASEKDEAIKKIAALLRENYVFPDKAREMASYVRKQNKQKAYEAIHSYPDFVEALNGDLQRTHRDLHLGLQYNPQEIAAVRKWESVEKPDSAFYREQLRKGKRMNFGFVKVEHLPGNIGYIEFHQFFPLSQEARQTVASAMSFVRNADAVILDLRQNGGGHPEMVQLVMSYFFNEKPFHYNSLYDRPSNTTKDYYTLKKVEGPRMPEVDLYVLTSGFTFSAAEELSYNLQTQKRATIVGEVTGGGAHPTQAYIVNDDLVLHVPVARAINAVTKTNWEGRGVMPDVPSEAGNALLKAQYLALEKLMNQKKAPREKAELEWELLAVASELHPVQLSKEVQAKYAGRYGESNIHLQGNELYYQVNNSPKRKLAPITEDIFRVHGLDFFRIQIVKDASGSVTKLRCLYKDGSMEESARTN
ncbi:S41 family peptidase [Nafulsella turpanensis]|uniref:S41 family peptidase n=1 Tax=Nafulsella turpanensis TaxID=1265690 RepID=UPI0003485CAD|nr:S41 family peptidase [Nafulsella turpanensis]